MDWLTRWRRAKDTILLDILTEREATAAPTRTHQPPQPIDIAMAAEEPSPRPEFVLMDTDELRAKYPSEPVKFDQETGKAVIIDLKLFAIDLAMRFDARAIMELSDGSSSRYDWGEGAYHGFADTGYDWRDIRDSSNAAKDRMFIEARRILKQHRQRLHEIGLSEELIAALMEDK